MTPVDCCVYIYIYIYIYIPWCHRIQLASLSRQVNWCMYPDHGGIRTLRNVNIWARLHDITWAVFTVTIMKTAFKKKLSVSRMKLNGVTKTRTCRTETHYVLCDEQNIIIITVTNFQLYRLVLVWWLGRTEVHWALGRVFLDIPNVIT